MLIRDQKPMTDATLAPALIDMTPAEWYALLNERVFFWVSETRLEGLLNAYRHRENLVLVLDTAKVMARHAAQVTLSPINSGFSRRWPQPARAGHVPGPLRIGIPFGGMGGKTVAGQAVAECAVSGGVANVREALIETRPVPRRTPSAMFDGIGLARFPWNGLSPPSKLFILMGRQWLQAKREVANLKKGQVVGRLVKEIMVAAKLGGPDPAGNARLFTADRKRPP